MKKQFTTTLILILSLSVILNAQNKKFAICQDELKEMNDALWGFNAIKISIWLWKP